MAEEKLYPWQGKSLHAEEQLCRRRDRAWCSNKLREEQCRYKMVSKGDGLDMKTGYSLKEIKEGSRRTPCFPGFAKGWIY